MTRYLFALLSCLLLAGSLSAGDNAKPNTLTPAEIRDGWVLLFDGETTFGWKSTAPVKVEGGLLMVTAPQRMLVLETTTEWGDFDLEFEFRGAGKDSSYLTMIGGAKNTKAGHPLQFDRDNPAPPWQLTKATFRFDAKTGGYVSEHTTRINANSTARGRVAQKIHGDMTAGTRIGFTVPVGTSMAVRNIKLRPVGGKSLFNGKDLAGWKVHPDKKSKYSVTREGWLNVKNGPGDIQTTGKFKDFVLQLECISNGKHLNSGIFFRCIPDVYQMGYEAQIRNEFTPGQERVYKLDNIDPQTHKLIGKVDVKSTAVDFGTGAIYRRMPARKGIAKDDEWFTLTLVANGRHFATWVNGIQVVDWTDHRPLHDNARQGCCLKAGPLSIQGHDPTTDLSFRNFRIAEFVTPPKGQ